MLQELEKAAVQSPQVTLQDEIDEAIQKGYIGERGGRVLYDLQSSNNNMSPEDVERHSLIAKSVLELATKAGASPRYH